MQDDGKLLLEPATILDYLWSKARKKVLQEALEHWTGTTSDDATWEPLSELLQQFAHLNLGDKIHSLEGGNVMTRGHVEIEEMAESNSG